MAQPSSAQVTLGNVARAYKELFPQVRVEQIAMRDRDFLRWVPKSDSFTGYAVDGSGGFYHIPYKYEKPQTVNSSFANVQTLANSANVAGYSKVKSVQLPRKRYYGYLTIDEEAAAAARDRTGSFYSPKEGDTEDLIAQVMETLESSLWRQGGHLGSVSAISTTLITLANAGDVINYAPGMYLAFNSAIDGSGTDTGSDGPYYVTAVDFDNAQITLNGNGADDGTPIAVGNYIFRGDGSTTDASAGDAGNMPSSVADWIPYTAESGTATFNGMSRTDSIVHLQGWRQASEGSIEETIKKLISRMMQAGARPDSIWMSYNSWFILEQELGARAGRQDGTAATFGLPTLTYSSPRGPIKVYAAAFCPDNRFYLLKRSTWKFLHLNALPHIVMTDGTRYRVMTGADAMELRVRWWGNLACFNMFHNGVGEVVP